MRLVCTMLLMGLLTMGGRAQEKPPGVVIDYQPAASRQYIGSPSIVIAPDGNYVATHDLFGPGSTSTVSAESKVFVSHDRGVSWKQVAQFKDQFWSNLFVLNKRIYLMGTTYEYGRIVIRVSDDNGVTWSDAHSLTEDTGYHTAPTTMAFQNGRIYRAFEFHPKGPWGSFRALMMSAPVDADLTRAESWKFTERLPFPAGEEGRTWLEGNAIVGPDGKMLDILRVDNRERGAVLELDGDRLKVRQFIDLPGGAKKFTIRYDKKSKLYWSLVNPALPGETLSVSTPASVRNTLTVVSSPDLVHWTPRSIVMHHADPAKYGFQYVDWQFDGNDMIAAVRTSFVDDAGGPHNFHDANYLLFRRITGFRKLGKMSLKGESFTAAEVASAEQMKKWTAVTLADAQRNPAGVGSEPMGIYEHHTTTLTTRVKTGEAEQHRDWADVFVVVSGNGSLVSGGHLVKSRVIGDGEERGDSIEGGSSVQVETGSVIHIGPGVPHQLVLAGDAPFTYFVVKVKTSPDSHSTGSKM